MLFNKIIYIILIILIPMNSYPFFKENLKYNFSIWQSSVYPKNYKVFNHQKKDKLDIENIGFNLRTKFLLNKHINFHSIYKRERDINSEYYSLLLQFHNSYKKYQYNFDIGTNNNLFSLQNQSITTPLTEHLFYRSGHHFLNELKNYKSISFNLKKMLNYGYLNLRIGLVDNCNTDSLEKEFEIFPFIHHVNFIPKTTYCINLSYTNKKIYFYSNFLTIPFKTIIDFNTDHFNLPLYYSSYTLKTYNFILKYNIIKEICLELDYLYLSHDAKLPKCMHLKELSQYSIDILLKYQCIFLKKLLVTVGYGYEKNELSKPEYKDLLSISPKWFKGDRYGVAYSYRFYKNFYGILKFNYMNGLIDLKSRFIKGNEKKHWTNTSLSFVYNF